MKSNLAYSPEFRLLHENTFSQVWENEITGEKALISNTRFEPGQIISAFSAGITSSQPTYLTVQVDLEKHITLQPEFLQYINHSCNPNAFFDTSGYNLICIREIVKDDEITFFYPSTEWDMKQPFACRCHSSNCLKYIQGAAHLPQAIIPQYKLTDFIQRQLYLHQPITAATEL